MLTTLLIAAAVLTSVDDLREAEARRAFGRTFDVEATLVRSPEVSDVTSDDDVYDWECAGWFPPKKPFVVEFAPKELLEEYYAHLRKTYREFGG